MGFYLNKIFIAYQKTCVPFFNLNFLKME